MLVFFMARLTGSPADLYLPLDATLEARQEFNEKYGFDRPLIEQFGTFVAGLSTFDLGHSIRKDRPAIEVVLEAFPTTLALAVAAMPVAIVSRARGRRARRLPAGRRVRPGRQRRLAGRRQRARLLARDHRHPSVRGHAGLAADIGHRHRLALAHAGRRAGAAALRHAGAGRPRRDDRRAELALRQDGARQGRAGEHDHLRARAAQRHAAGDHGRGRPRHRASSTAP